MTDEGSNYHTEERPGGIRPDALLRYGDPNYAEPTTDDISAAIAIAGLSEPEAEQLLGVSSPTIRQWTGGEQAMPYSAWRLLGIYARLVRPETIAIDTRGRHWVVRSWSEVGATLAKELEHAANVGEPANAQLKRAQLLASTDKILRKNGDTLCPYCFVVSDTASVLRGVSSPDHTDRFRCGTCNRVFAIDPM